MLRDMAIALTLTLLLAIPPHSRAATVDESPILAVADHLASAMNARDLEKIIRLLDPNVTVTWQHGRVAIGRQGVRDYWARVFGGSDPVIKEFAATTLTPPRVVFHGANTAVVFGVVRDRYLLKGEINLTLDVYWSATALKREDGWRFISLHFSNNTFDNAVLSKTKALLWWVAIGGLAIGTLATWLVMRGRFKQSQPR